jgi:hypothetical protein
MKRWSEQLHRSSYDPNYSRGNFVTGNDTQTDAVLRSGFLEYAMDLLDHQSKAIKEYLLGPFNIATAKYQAQITALFHNFESDALFAKLVKYSMLHGNSQGEAVWAFCAWAPVIWSALYR